MATEPSSARGGGGSDSAHQSLRAAREHVRDPDVRIEDLAGTRVGVRRSDREARVGAKEPAHRRMTRVERVEVGIIGLDLRDDRIRESDPLERLVPHQDAFDDGRAIGLRHVAIDPEHDRLLRIGQRRRRILLLEAPAIDQIGARRRRGVGREVGDVGGEVPDPVIRVARLHRFGQREEVVDETHEHAARIGRRGRRHRRERVGRRHDARQARRAEVVAHREARALVVCADLREARVGDGRVRTLMRNAASSSVE